MSLLTDNETILSLNEHWNSLNEEWGEPIDLEEDNEPLYPALSLPSLTAGSQVNLDRMTFNSAEFLEQLKENYAQQLARRLNDSLADYELFQRELTKGDVSFEETFTSVKPFYYVGGNIISQRSVENICDSIDRLFKPLEGKKATTSTMRAKRQSKARRPSIIQGSCSISGLSFDDTAPSSKIMGAKSLANINEYIEELFQSLNASGSRIISLDELAEVDTTADQSQGGEVKFIDLVKKFSDLEKQTLQTSQKKRQLTVQFAQLQDFWKNQF